jgi:hypothetical protein
MSDQQQHNMVVHQNFPIPFIRDYKSPFEPCEFIDRKSVLFYLCGKGWTARNIHQNLPAKLGEEAIGYGMVTE